VFEIGASAVTAQRQPKLAHSLPADGAFTTDSWTAAWVIKRDLPKNGSCCSIPERLTEDSLKRIFLSPSKDQNE
jgi:hypothetical protein